jgi:hypothetical protein
MPLRLSLSSSSHREPRECYSNGSKREREKMPVVFLDSVSGDRRYRAFAHLATDGAEAASPHFMSDVLVMLHKEGATASLKWLASTKTGLSATVEVNGVRLKVECCTSKRVANVASEAFPNRAMHVRCFKTLSVGCSDGNALMANVTADWMANWPVKTDDGTWKTGSTPLAFVDDNAHVAVQFISDALLADAIMATARLAAGSASV